MNYKIIHVENIFLIMVCLHIIINIKTCNTVKMAILIVTLKTIYLSHQVDKND